MSEAATVAELALKGAGIHQFQVEGVPYVAVPDGTSIHDYPGLLDAPKRIMGVKRFRDAESFGAYINRYKQPGTLIVGSRDTGKFECTIDYHEAQNDPKWGSHGCGLDLRFTEEWKAWSTIGPSLTQSQFAEFIEDWMHTIAAPDGATLQNMVLKFQSMRESVFKKSISLQDGSVNLTYIDEEKSLDAKFPGQLTLVMGVFEGQLPIQVDARIRYRITGDKLSFQVALLRKPEFLRKAFEDVCEAVENITEIKPLMGA